MRRPEQGDRATHDHVQQAVRIVVIEQRERGFVEGAQVRVREGPVRDPPVDRLHLVERSVRDRDELVLGPAVVREAGETGADRHDRARIRVEPGGRLGARANDAADPFGDLVRDDPVGAGEDGREFVAAVSIEAVAVARSGGHGSRDVH